MPLYYQLSDTICFVSTQFTLYVFVLYAITEKLLVNESPAENQAIQTLTESLRTFGWISIAGCIGYAFILPIVKYVKTRSAAKKRKNIAKKMSSVVTMIKRNSKIQTAKVIPLGSNNIELQDFEAEELQ